MTTTRPRLAALAGAALVTVIAAGCTQSTPDPGPKVTNVTPPASTTSTRTTTPASSTTSTPTTTSMSAEEQAYAKARKAYDAYTASFTVAAATYDPTKLDRAAATEPLVKATAAEIRRLTPANSKNASMKWTQQIKDVRPTRYVEGKQVQLQVCAIIDGRFLKDGKDVTVDRDGNPRQPNTDAKSNQVQFVSADDGKTWKMNSFVYSPEIGASC